MSKVKAVFFDFGGVFTDSPFHAVHSYGQGIGATEKQIIEIVFGGYGDDGAHPWHKVERGEISLEATRDEILLLGREQGLEVDIYDVFMAMAANGGGLRDNLVEYTAKIKGAGLITGIITNNVLEFKDHWRSMLAVEELFDFVVDSSEVGMRKPNPDIFHHALALAGVDAGEAIFLDDFLGNVQAAQALDITAIHVDGDGKKTVTDLDKYLGLQR
ncbi:MAG: HAD family phosphatase [Pseudomonadales bacterium]